LPIGPGEITALSTHIRTIFNGATWQAAIADVAETSIEHPKRSSDTTAAGKTTHVAHECGMKFEQNS
jgi:hypothetical protein